jgi:hypothetical protein
LAWLRHEHIKWAKRRERFKDAIERACRAAATCGGIDDQERPS